MLSSGEIDGQGAFVYPGAERRHGDVGEGRKHHEVGKAVEEHRHEEVPQPKHLLHCVCVCVKVRGRNMECRRKALCAIFQYKFVYIYSVYKWAFL